MAKFRDNSADPVVQAGKIPLTRAVTALTMDFIAPTDEFFVALPSAATSNSSFAAWRVYTSYAGERR
jgi:hypothetical protein